MDYEEITDKLIRDVLMDFNLHDVYQEFLDSIVKFNDFKDVSNEEFRDYLDNKEYIE